LPTDARNWLNEDAIYLISPEERCAFLHLSSDVEREQFIEQFWYRRSVDPDSPDDNFRLEHYHRIATANEKYKEQFPEGGELEGWKSDRGRIYVLFGAPDSVRPHSRTGSGDPLVVQPEADCPSEIWHYQNLEASPESEEIEFEFVHCDWAYRLVRTQESENRMSKAWEEYDYRKLGVCRKNLAGIELCVGPMLAPKVVHKDLEAIVISRIVREQIKLSTKIEFAAATERTTLARMDVQILRESPGADGQIVSQSAYQLFIRVSKPSGWVVQTTELNAREQDDSKLSLNAHLDMPLEPGSNDVTVVAKRVETGEVGVVRERIDVPGYETLKTKK
jgi:GWxTD domain-containing protein